MNIFKSINIINLTIFITIIIDLLNIKFYPKIQTFLFNTFNSSQTKTVYAFLKIYILFVILLVFISMMSAYSSEHLVIREITFWKKTGEWVYTLMIIGYLIILLFPVIQLISPGTEKSYFSSNQQRNFMIIFMILFFAAVFMAFIEWKPRFYPGKINYLMIYVPILILVNFFLQFSSALWRYSFVGDKVQAETFKSQLLSLLLILPIYLLFFSALRLLLLSKSFNWFSFALTVVSTLFFAWKSAVYL